MSSKPHKGKRLRKNKLGRNDPCFCGSGKKYKKCCLLKGIDPPKTFSEVPQEVIDAHNRMMQKQAFFNSKGIYISLPNTVAFKGKKFLAVANKIMYDDNPDATFHQLILRNLSLTLGKEWWDVETAKPINEKHFIKRCYEELQGSENRDDLEVTREGKNLRSMRATGDTQALLSLAFDVWLLTHKGFMPDEWLERLRDREAYQGVRYEIGVASMLVRMGCNLEFYDPNERDENGKQPKRAEFIAIHEETRNRVAVEAKSRQREGVIHAPGTLKYSRAIRGDISTLYKKALEKKTDGLPLIVFVDVNSPTEANQHTIDTQWAADIQRSFESRPAPTPENPDKHTALFVTNFSSHYQGENISHAGQYICIGSNHPQVQFADGFEGIFLGKLLQSVENYGFVPHDMDNPDDDTDRAA